MLLTFIAILLQKWYVRWGFLPSEISILLHFIGILQMFSSELMKMEFITLAQFLTKLPENISEENLFQSIGNITISREKFNQILTEQTQKVLQLYPADKLKQHPTLRK